MKADQRLTFLSVNCCLNDSSKLFTSSWGITNVLICLIAPVFFRAWIKLFFSQLWSQINLYLCLEFHSSGSKYVNRNMQFLLYRCIFDVFVAFFRYKKNLIIAEPIDWSVDFPQFWFKTIFMDFGPWVLCFFLTLKCQQLNMTFPPVDCLSWHWHVSSMFSSLIEAIVYCIMCL